MFYFQMGGCWSLREFCLAEEASVCADVPLLDFFSDLRETDVFDFELDDVTLSCFSPEPEEQVLVSGPAWKKSKIYLIVYHILYSGWTEIRCVQNYFAIASKFVVMSTVYAAKDLVKSHSAALTIISPYFQI